VVVWDAHNQREIVLLTNLFEFGSTTVAAIYREPWRDLLGAAADQEGLRLIFSTRMFHILPAELERFG
jgi:hypothetical protein